MHHGYDHVSAVCSAVPSASPTNSPPTDGATVMVQGMCFKYSNYTEVEHVALMLYHLNIEPVNCLTNSVCFACVVSDGIVENTVS
eukprot:SAG31_NODE_276_length_18650_cov_5.821842_2_plen_85_part_00